MESLKLSFNTFLKISSKKPKGKLAELKRFTSPGGYDFYKVLKKLARAIASGETDFEQAYELAGKITRVPERIHTLAALKVFNGLPILETCKWCEPPKKQYQSESGLLVIKLEPDLGFQISNEIKQYLQIWNLTKPALTQTLSGEGLWLLSDEMGKPDNSFGILNLRTNSIVEETAITDQSGILLAHDMMIIEEIWKDIHDSKMSDLDTVSHIKSLAISPPK